ncbi:GlxA family transcriptional regulator [Castellaniella sp.]|uniref:GlxA family transcriptional regulator n=1 Tax=Castellaniella sp. TaxID=1955812 RepID=UPI002AFF3406|nr:GlxA family transcriptional regulator [Castellaniella sp.]
MDKGPVRFGFILLPHFTLTAFSGMLDVLRLAGDEGDHSRPLRCSWQVIDETLTPVRSSSGIQVVPSETLGDPSRFDYLVVVGGLLKRPPVNPGLLEFIRQAARADVTLVGLCTGVFTLMQAGVLAGHRICISWFHYWDFLERFPATDPGQVCADRLYVFDRRRITCSGGRASIDVAAEILGRHVDRPIVQKALRILQVDDAGRANAAQPLPPGAQPATHPVVRRAVLLMEQHVGRALGLGELAGRLGISVRHLERLFKEATGQSPQAYARGIRLRLAAWMLTHTKKTISAIASECGFSDASHLGREFRAAFLMSPSAWRDRAQLPDALLPPRGGEADYVSEVFPDRREFF